MVVFLAGYLREKREVLAQGRLKDLGPLLVIWAATMLVLVATNDLGSALLYFGIFLAMLYIATGAALVRPRRARALPRRRLSSPTGRSRTSHERITNWLHPWTTHKVLLPAQRDSWRSGRTARATSWSSRSTRSRTAASAAPASARARSRPTGGTQLIPDVKTDFIYSALAQELGLVGVSALLLVFMVFVARGMKVALRVDDGFSKLLAAGLTFGFALQTFTIVGGILRLIPLTGITLPFVSYGGSSIVANFLLLAGLLLVSHRANVDVVMNQRISQVAHRLARPARRADRRDDVLADLGLGGPRRAAGQRDPARRAVHDRPRDDLSPRTARPCSPTNVKKKVKDGQTLYFRTYPTPRARLAGRRLLDPEPLAHRASSAPRTAT